MKHTNIKEASGFVTNVGEITKFVEMNDDCKRNVEQGEKKNEGKNGKRNK